MKNDEKIDILLEEEMTDEMSLLEKAERNYETAHRYLDIAKFMKKYEDRDKYFYRGIAYMKKCQPTMDVKAELRTLRLTLFKERAEGRIALYDEGIDLLNRAKTPGDYSAAYSLFERIYRHEQTHNIPQDLIPVELYKKVAERQDSKEKMEYCEKMEAQLASAAKKRSRISSLIVIALLVAGALFTQTLGFNMVLARMYFMSKSYTPACQQYEYLARETGDAKYTQLSQECHYLAGKQYIEDGDLSHAVGELRPLTNVHYKDSEDLYYSLELQVIKDAEIGDEVGFGQYDNAQLKWFVLDKTEDSALLFKREALTRAQMEPYNEEQVNTTWETSHLREWLNSTYMDDVFSEKEQAAIKTTVVPADDNEKYEISGGKDTKDKVYIFSRSDFLKYGSQLYTTQASWWLRTPGSTPKSAMFIDPKKNIMDYGYDVTCREISTKPVMWVKYK